MKTLTKIIEGTGLCGFGSIVPTRNYRAIFPNSREHDPYFLALKHTIINMACIAKRLSSAAIAASPDSIAICHEDGDTSAEAYTVYRDLKALQGWVDAKYLDGFTSASKRLNGLQGADLIAREAFKHAVNLGVRKIRKPVKSLQTRLSFHLWTNDC